MDQQPRAKKTILFVHPWAGPLGPNAVMEKLARECLARGHRVVMAIRELDECLRQLRDDGVEMHVIPHLELTGRMGSLWRLARHLWRSWRAMRQTAELCRQVNAEVVCVNSEIMFLMPRVGMRTGRRVVVVVHTARFNALGALSRIFYGIQRRWVWRFVAVSHTVAQVLVKTGVPAEQVEVVYNGVDGQKYQPGPRRPELRRQLGVPADAPLFGDVSHVVPRKGAHHLVEVLARVRQVIPAACCLIVGDIEKYTDHEYVRKLTQRAEELGIADGLILTGNRTDIPDVLREMDLMVHASQTEAFGLVIAEAMATGLPIVGFDVEAVGELIEDGRTGRLVRPLDETAMAKATLDLLQDPELRRQMGRAGRAKALRDFDQARNAGLLIDLLEQACVAGVWST